MVFCHIQKIKIQGGKNMTHNEKLLYLIEELQKELPQFSGMRIPEDIGMQGRLLRTYMNMRAPEPISSEFLKIQDEYLKEVVEEKGIVIGDALPPSHVNSRIVLWKGDITTLKVDAIVNSANSTLRGCFVPCHFCIDNIIHSMSGIQLRLACDEIMKEQGYDEPAGRAKITPAFNLPCNYVIHTVGPVITKRLMESHCSQLADCYKSCLELASEKGLKSIAFCCISTGTYHFPKEKAAEIAVETVMEFLKTNLQLERVIFDTFTEEEYNLYKEML